MASRCMAPNPLFLTLVASVVSAASILSVVQVASAADHPRLLFSARDVKVLRERVKSEPYKSMLQRLIADAERPDKPDDDPDTDYNRVHVAQRCGFLYVLTGDEAYAAKARQSVEPLLQSRNWGNRRVKGLSLYYVGKGVALAYDWCHGSKSWDADFSALVSKKLLEQAEVVSSNGGTQQNRSPASNWQGLRWSTAGLMYLATDEPFDLKKLEQCYGRVRQYLVDNLGTDRNARGWNIEGLGYTYYPMANGVAPFAVAMYLRDPKLDLRKTSPATRLTLWTCFAALVKTDAGPMWRPDFGDDNPGTRGEGSLGFAFWFTPRELLPGVLYWYEKTVGADGDKTWDNERFGTISSILFHPGDTVKPKDPMTIPEWRQALLDTGGNGFLTWRNHYKDASDVVAQLYVKLRGNKGHHGPDALSFRIVGQNTIWATGGGRYGPKLNGRDAFERSMNTLYPGDPDGDFRTNGNSGKIVTPPIIREDGSGHVVVSVAQNNVGTRDHIRWFAAEFSPKTGAHAAFVIADTSTDGRAWQMVTLATNPITTDGNTFTITGPDGSTMRGTVLHPSGPVKFTVGKRIRGSNAGDVGENNFVHFGSDDGNYLVVLTLARKGEPHPPVSADGTWKTMPRGSVKVGQWSLKIDGTNIRSSLD